MILCCHPQPRAPLCKGSSPPGKQTVFPFCLVLCFELLASHVFGPRRASTPIIPCGRTPASIKFSCFAARVARAAAQIWRDGMRLSAPRQHSRLYFWRFFVISSRESGSRGAARRGGTRRGRGTFGVWRIARLDLGARESKFGWAPRHQPAVAECTFARWVGSRLRMRTRPPRAHRSPARTGLHAKRQTARAHAPKLICHRSTLTNSTPPISLPQMCHDC